MAQVSRSCDQRSNIPLADGGGEALHSLPVLRVCTQQSGLTGGEKSNVKRSMCSLTNIWGKFKSRRRKKILKKCFLVCVNLELLKSQNNIIRYKVVEG